MDLSPDIASSVLSYEWGGNTVLRMATALAVFLGLAGLFRFVLPPVLRRLELLAHRSVMKADDVIVSRLKSIPHGVLYLLALLAGVSLLDLPPTAHAGLKACILVILISLGISFAQQVIEFVLVMNVPGLRTVNGSLPTVLRITLTLVLWGFGVLLILSNLGINVISLVAGLGIGGIAVALALQNILSDMFSSFALYLDKPFREGDFIVVGEHMGVVKNIGLKTTRVQALQGEEIVISNQELTSTRIQNFKRMNERRVQLRFGVTYDTTPAQLREVTVTVRSLFEGRKNVRFDRAHFFSFGDSSLDFEVVYYILSADYNVFMDIQQEINLALYEQLEQQGISFAFPTRTLHLVKEGA